MIESRRRSKDGTAPWDRRRRKQPRPKPAGRKAKLDRGTFLDRSRVVPRSSHRSRARPSSVRTRGECTGRTPRSSKGSSATWRRSFRPRTPPLDQAHTASSPRHVPIDLALRVATVRLGEAGRHRGHEDPVLHLHRSDAPRLEQVRKPRPHHALCFSPSLGRRYGSARTLAFG